MLSHNIYKLHVTHNIYNYKLYITQDSKVTYNLDLKHFNIGTYKLHVLQVGSSKSIVSIYKLGSFFSQLVVYISEGENIESVYVIISSIPIKWPQVRTIVMKMSYNFSVYICIKDQKNMVHKTMQAI